MILQEINAAQSNQTSLLSTLCDDCHLLAWIQTLQTSNTDTSSSPWTNLLKCLCSKVTFVTQLPVELQNTTTQWQAAMLRLLQWWRLLSVSGC